MPFHEPTQILREAGERFVLKGVDYIAIATNHDTRSTCHTCAFYPNAQAQNCHDHRCNGPDLIFLPLVEAVTLKLTGKLDAQR